MRDGTGPARLLDMVGGRSKRTFQTWLSERDPLWRERIEVIAMDGFTGFKTAATEDVPQAVTVMDPFHVVRLPGDALNDCRRRVHNDTFGHRGRRREPLYDTRRTLQTGSDRLNDKQEQRLAALFADDRHAAVDLTWWAPTGGRTRCANAPGSPAVADAGSTSTATSTTEGRGGPGGVRTMR